MRFKGYKKKPEGNKFSPTPGKIGLKVMWIFGYATVKEEGVIYSRLHTNFVLFNFKT